MNFKINLAKSSLKRNFNIIAQDDNEEVESSRPEITQKRSKLPLFDEPQKASEVKDVIYDPVDPTCVTMDSKSDSNQSASDNGDELDIFMAELNKEIADQENLPKDTTKGRREDLANEDEHEEYIRFMDTHRNEEFEEENCQFEFDEDGNITGKISKEEIDPLPCMDHSHITYAPFGKNFYTETDDIKNLTEEEVAALRNKLNIKVSGRDPPKPVTSFAHFGLHRPLLECVRKSGYTVPTAIQSQGIPAVLGGRDIIGIAKTGSGKTLAFLLPMIMHIIDQDRLKHGEGPIGLVVCPTRELAQQTYKEAVKYGRPYKMRTVCAYGGGNLYEQQKVCQAGAEVVVCTPGRLIDLIAKKSVNLGRVTFLVFDEADRLFELGFESQVRSIANSVRPDRQALLFSATFKWKAEKLARDVLVDPVRVLHGEVAGEINEDITQVGDLLPSEEDKWEWLRLRIVSFMSVGSVLIFVARIQTCMDLLNKLRLTHKDVCGLHGDMTQFERDDIIVAFRNRQFRVMVATDVAARGLDIHHIKTVINYDPAKNMDVHTHRCGRTGRAGEKGTAYTLLTSKDKEFAGQLVRQMELSNQFVNKPLLDLASKNPWFKRSKPSQSFQSTSSNSFSSIKESMMTKYRSRFVAAGDNRTPPPVKPGSQAKKSRWSN